MLHNECGALTAHVERAATAEPGSHSKPNMLQALLGAAHSTLEVGGAGQSCRA